MRSGGSRLQQVAGRAGADRGEQVLLGAGRGEDDDLAVRRRLAEARQRREPVHVRHREVEQDEVRLEPLRPRRSPRRRRRRAPTTSKPCAFRSDASASRVSGWSSTMRTRVGIRTLIGTDGSADKREVKDGGNDFQGWLLGEILLAGLLGASLALFLTHPVLQTQYDLP